MGKTVSAFEKKAPAFRVPQGEPVSVQRPLDTTGEVICAIDSTGTFVHVSAGSQWLWGYRPEEMMGRSYLELVASEDHKVTATVADAIRNGTAVSSFENRYVRKDGTILSVLWTITWCKESEIFYCVAKDAAKVKEAQKQKDFQERRLQRAYKLAGLAWWEYDIATQIYTSSAEILRMYGAPAIENKQSSLQEFLAYVHPDDAEKLSYDLSELGNDTYLNYEHRIIKPSGEVIHVLHYMEIVRDENGNPLALHGTAKNITEEKNKEAALKLANERYELASRATSEALWDWDINTDTCYFNKGFTTQFGFDNVNDAIDTNWVENIHENDKARVLASINKALADAAVSQWQDEYMFYRKDRSVADVLDRGFIIRDENGKAVRMVGAMQDITRQKAAERTIKLSEEKYKLLFYDCPKPKWMFDAETLQLKDVNKAALELYGYTAEEFLQLTVPDLKVKTDVPEVVRLKGLLPHRYQNVVRHVKKNGKEFHMEISAHAIQLPSGKHFIVTGDDLTEKLHLQQKLIQEKLAAEKQVARAIINTQEKERSIIGKELHDNVCQLLTTAKLYVENVKHFPEQRYCFAEKGASLLGQSINEIRYLSKQLVPPLISDIGLEASLNELVNHYNILGLFTVQASFRIQEQALAKDLKLTVYRIIQELLNNVAKYAQASAVCICICEENDHLKVLVQDNGQGFDVKKATTGLGLRNVRNRAEIFQGQVQIETETGKGCKTNIIFPLGEIGRK